MYFAKPHLDIGLYTTQRDAHLAFWGQNAGLTFDQMVKLGNGVQQHRFLALSTPLESIIKVNHARDPIQNGARTGIAALSIARPNLTSPRQLTDPDGNQVSLVPSGYEGTVGIAIQLAVNDVGASGRFYSRVLGMTADDDHRFRLGGSHIQLIQSEVRVEPSDMPGPGFRYLTIQVYDCDAEHRAALEKGAREGRAPRTLGTTARVSFVRDPDGTWIEISQRASVTGHALP